MTVQILLLKEDIKLPNTEGINKQRSNVLYHDTLSVLDVIQFIVQDYLSNSLLGEVWGGGVCARVPQNDSLVVVVLNNKLISLKSAKLHLPHPPCCLQG